MVLKPELTSITGTKANQKAMLIGVVQGYETYIDIALSQQTKRQRIAFEENSGLAIVFPVEFINELVKTRAEADWKDQQAKANPPETAPMPEDAPAK